MSDPVYMAHYPSMWEFANYIIVEEPSMAELSWVNSLATILLIVLDYLVSQF